MQEVKVYVDVNATLTKEGTLIPTSLVWEDGRTYEIDKIVRKQNGSDRKAGGTGVIYTCMVGGKECHLIYEVDKFFVQRK